MLELRNVGKTYPHTVKRTLKDINLTIEEGEFICIVGPSGCGKTTLLNLVAGLEEPTKGEIFLDGIPVKGPGADRVVMFQEAALYPWLNVLDNVMLGMEFLGIPKEERKNRALKYLKMVHLSQFTEYPIHQLSGGMRQRAALARALSMDSKILLMDEPFSALDKQTTNMLRGELEQIWMNDRIVVLSENPGQIKEIIFCDLKRPRQIDQEEFVHMRHRLLESVKKEVEKFAKEEYDKN